MDREVTYEYENGGWVQMVRSNERKTLPSENVPSVCPGFPTLRRTARTLPPKTGDRAP